MAKNSSVTNPLNVGAMYQIGAAGSGNLRSSKEVPGIMKAIGNIAINWYAGIQQNKALIRKEQNQQLSSLDNTMRENDVIDSNVTRHKENLVAANKILTSARWNLYKDSDTYKDAETLKNQTLYAMKNLAKSWTGWGKVKKAQISLFKGETKDQDGNTIDYKNSTTLEEQYNTSLAASGQLDNAIMSDDNGDLIVVTWNGKVSETNQFDNPNTKKVETKENYQEMLDRGEITTVKLKDFPMIANYNDEGIDEKAAGNKTHYGNDFVKTYAKNGTDGYEMDNEEHAMARHTLSSNINNMHERSFMKFVFDGDEFGFTDGDEIGSVFDKLVKDSESQIGIDIDGNAIKDDPTTEIDESKAAGPYDTNFDGKIDEVEKKGAETIIRQSILSGDYKRGDVINLYQKKGEEIYQTKFDKFEADKKETERKYNRRIRPPGPPKVNKEYDPTFGFNTGYGYFKGVNPNTPSYAPKGNVIAGTVELIKKYETEGSGKFTGYDGRSYSYENGKWAIDDGSGFQVYDDGRNMMLNNLKLNTSTNSMNYLGAAAVDGGDTTVDVDSAAIARIDNMGSKGSTIGGKKWKNPILGYDGENKDVMKYWNIEYKNREGKYLLSIFSRFR